MTKKNSSIPSLKEGGIAVESDLDKAALFNRYFSKCFNQSVPPLNDEDILEFSSINPLLCPEEFLCTEHEVVEMLSSLDIKKANGRDGISARMLRSTAASIAHGITLLFNKSITTGQIPKAWKTSSVVPVPKGSEPTSASNYRPISLLPVVSKLLEKHMHFLISCHIKTSYPIASHQWGFQPGKSAVSALVDVLRHWSSALDQRKEVAAVFFDLRKAFDSVPLRPLLNKLKSVGLSDHLIKWICSYLTNRVQHVVLNGQESTATPVLSGVPQGSVLGPLLFLLYINDLANGSLSEGCFVSLYADDLLLYKVITCPEDYTTLQSDINSVASWITQHHLSFNTSKCKCMTVTRLRQNSVSPPVLQLNGKPMENVTSYKYLGVTLTSDLTWSDHIHNITRKARRLTGMLYRQFYRWSSPTALSSLYVSLVRPHLEHAAPAWNTYLIKDINSLESVQKFALKVCLKQWDTPYHQLLSQACLPDLSTRRKHLSLCYFYKLINGVYLYHDLPLVPHTSQYALRNNHSVVQFSAHTNCFYYSFFPYVTSLWNTLPDSITSAPSIYTFKNLVHLV